MFKDSENGQTQYCPMCVETTRKYAPLDDEYFKGLDIKTIAELAKKSIRLTTENRELEEKNERLKIKVSELTNRYSELLNKYNDGKDLIKDDIQEKLSLILSKYGFGAQKRKMQEECAELIRAIARDDEDNILEEMADVSVLIEQFKAVAEYKSKIEEIEQRKIERTLERIEKI